MNGSSRARLLVATPELLDPNFHRVVVLMLEHNQDGALGLVLNRPRLIGGCLLYTSPSPRDQRGSRMPSSA